MWPRSGGIRPRASLSSVLLPEPAMPSRILVSPRGKENDTPSRTTLSSKAMATSSKTMGFCADSCPASATDPGCAKEDTRLLEDHQAAGDEEVGHDDQHG